MVNFVILSQLKIRKKNLKGENQIRVANKLLKIKMEKCFCYLFANQTTQLIRMFKKETQVVH